MLYPWQNEDWQRLQDLRERWPHALLLYGQPGIGKYGFATHLAQALLCEAPAAARPCGTCIACNWFAQGNHPDFRAVLPEALQAVLTPASEAGEGGKRDTRDKAEGESGKARTPSKEIKVEQIRALLEFCALGSHRGGVRVALIYPAESMNATAANALLKTLEEPPPGVVFLLVCGAPERLLPTIVSRCRRWPLSVPDRQVAEAWLAGQGMASPADALATAGGAPLLAAETAGDALRQRFVELLADGARCDVFACGEAIGKTPMAECLGWLQRWCYDLLAVRLSGAVRYFPQHTERLRALAAHVDAAALANFLSRLSRQRRVADHPLNVRLAVEALCIEYRQLFALPERD